MRVILSVKFASIYTQRPLYTNERPFFSSFCSCNESNMNNTINTELKSTITKPSITKSPFKSAFKSPVSQLTCLYTFTKIATKPSFNLFHISNNTIAHWSTTRWQTDRKSTKTTE